MTLSIKLVCLIIALICFFIAAIEVPTWKIHPGWLGLLFLTLAEFVAK